MSAKRNNSPYSAITGCPFMFYEFERILPMMMNPDSAQLLKDEIENNQILQINNLMARKRFGKPGRGGARQASEQGYFMPF